MKSYLGYIRVSTTKQGRGVSLDEQRAAIQVFADRKGIEISQWFVETETAAKQGRPEYAKLIKELKSGRAGGVVIHKIDRGARNMKDWANLGDLIDAGVDIQFAHESLDLRSRGGRLAADIQAVVAADYIRNLRDEVLKGFLGRLKQGFYPLPAPVGYLDCGGGKVKELDPKMAPLVRYAFERYASGNVSLDTLTYELAERGLRASRRPTISRNGLATMLHNSFYIGIINIRRRGVSFQGSHTPLIKKDLFDRVQDIMHGRSTPKNKEHHFLYRSLIVHPNCGRHLTGELIKGKFVYYRCHGQACKGTSIREAEIDRVVSDAIRRVALSIGELRDLRDLVEDARSQGLANDKEEAASLELQIAGCSDRLSRLTDAFLEGTISKQLYDERNIQLLEQRSGLKDRQSALNGDAPWVKTYKEFELNNTQIISYNSLSRDEKRTIIESLCSNFECIGKKPIIRLRFPYAELAELKDVFSGGPRRSDVRTRIEQIAKILSSYEYVTKSLTSSKSLYADADGARTYERAATTKRPHMKERKRRIPKRQIRKLLKAHEAWRKSLKSPTSL